MRIHIHWMFGLTIALAASLANAILAQESSSGSGQAAFHQAYFLHHHQGQAEPAIEAYQRALKQGVDPATHDLIKQQLQDLLEELAASDLAAIMPPETIGYLELSRPTEHFEKLAQAMGLIGPSPVAQSERLAIRIEDGLELPSDFQISPALLREFRKIRGAAVGITGINQAGPPMEGLLAINVGKSDLIGGLLETGLQLVPSADSLDGFPTYRIENRVWLVKTRYLLLISDSKDRISEGLQRLADAQLPSLDQEEHFQAARAQQPETALFAFVSPHRAMDKFSHLLRGEMGIARIMLDLDHLDYLTASLGATNQGLRGRLEIKYSEDHQSVGFNFLKTNSLGKRALQHVPGNAAVVLAAGVNPEMVMATQTVANHQLKAMDLGRELFANIEDICLFGLPSTTKENDEIPDFAAIISSNDLQKSQALWNQILSLPARLEIEQGPTADTTSILGNPAREYAFNEPGAPRLVIAVLDNEALLVGTRTAVTAAFQAHADGTTLANQDTAARFWAAQSENTSKALFVDLARAVELAAAMEPRQDAELQMIAKLVEGMNLSVVINESDNQLIIQSDLVGLPQLRDIMETLAQLDPELVRHLAAVPAKTAAAHPPRGE